MLICVFFNFKSNDAKDLFNFEQFNSTQFNLLLIFEFSEIGKTFFLILK